MPATIIGKYPKDTLGQDVFSLFWMVCFVACSTPSGAWYSNHNKPSITTLSAQGREERRKIGVALAFAVELSRQNSPSKPSSVAMVPETSRVSGRCNQCTRSSRPLWTPGGKIQLLGEWHFRRVLKLTWNLKMNPWKRRFLWKTIVFRFHVSFRGCILCYFWDGLIPSGKGTFSKHCQQDTHCASVNVCGIRRVLSQFFLIWLAVEVISDAWSNKYVS